MLHTFNTIHHPHPEHDTFVGSARTERWLFYLFFSLFVQAHFEQQEIVLIQCSGVCIFVGAKFYYIGGPWRAYLSYGYNDIHSGFSFFLFIPSCF